MGKLDVVGYADSYLSLKMHEELAEDKEVDERTREEVSELLSEVGDDGVLDWIRKEYNRLVDTQAEFQFSWSKSKFLDFTYKLMERGGLEGFQGELRMTIEEVEYTADVTAILRNDAYKIISISGFRQVTDLDKELFEMLEELEESVDESIEEAVEEEESDDDGKE
jgi:hypothetical protein